MPDTSTDTSTGTPGRVSCPAILNVGPPGAGKTFALATLAARRRLFYLFTDPGGDESLLDGLEYYNVPVDRVHWHYIPPAAEGWDALETLARQVNALDYESLAKIKGGIRKSDHNQFLKVVSVCADFECQRTGECFGPIEDLDPDECAFAFDSISGLNKIARDQTVGGKPVMHQGEWGVAMSIEETLVRKICSEVRCPRVMIAHLDQERDELSGRMMFNPAFLGKKLGPQVPALFSDVVLSYTEGGQFLWSTSDDRIALKNRNLPVNSKLKPDYGQILDKYERRRERVGRSETP